MAKAVDGVTTTYVVAVLGLSQVLMETAGGDSIVYLYGHDLLGEEGTTWVWHLGDGLGSVRQLADNSGNIALAQGYTPFGVPMWDEGSGATGYGFTGERWEAYSELLFLRARYYQPGTGRFLNKDPWGGSMRRPATLNGFSYVNNNPVRLVDLLGLCSDDPYDPYYDYDCWTLAATVAQLIGEPIGVVGESSYDSLYLAYNGPNYSTAEVPGGGRGMFDRTSVKSILGLKQALLSSARRHNRIPGMDNNGFAALVAATIQNEGRIGNYPAFPDRHGRLFQHLENAAAFAGCVVSGHYIIDALEHLRLEQAWRYFANEDQPEYATGGIGNTRLNTAADLWLGQWEIGPLRTIDASGQEYDIRNPFAPLTECSVLGSCATYEPSVLKSHQILGRQLLDNNASVEYVAANLEVGALRAMSKGLTPSAFNSVTWHMKGVQTKKEIETLGWNPGGAIWVLDQIPTALKILGLTSTWNLSMEPQYVYHRWDESRKGR